MTQYANQVFDINRPAKEILLERFNAINGTQFKPEHFNLGDPEVIQEEDADTRVKVVPVLNSPWVSSFFITYPRMKLQEIFAFQNHVATGQADHLYDILDQINEAYGIYLTQVDVQQSPITYTDPGDKSQPAKVLVRAKAGSHLYTGEMEISLNTQTRYGVSTFEQELLHFIAMRDEAQKIHIKTLSSLGYPSSQFVLGRNLKSFEIVEYRDMLFTHEGHLIVLGKFNASRIQGGTTENLENIRIAWFNQSGEMVKHSMSSSGFGIGNPKASVLLDNDSGEGVFWAINQNEGNQHKLVRYNAEGTRFVVPNTPELGALTLIKVKAWDQWLYGCGNDGLRGFVCRFNRVDGSFDSDFGIKYFNGVEYNAQSQFKVHDMDVDERGVYALGDAYSDTGGILHAVQTRSHLPVRALTHEGVVMDGFEKIHKGLSFYRVGQLGENTSKIASCNGAVIYNAKGMCNRACMIGQGVFGCSVDGSVANNPADYLREQIPLSIPEEMVLVQAGGKGQAYCAAQSQWIPGNEGVQSIWIGMYGSDGNFSGKVTHIPNAKLLDYRVRRY